MHCTSSLWLGVTLSLLVSPAPAQEFSDTFDTDSNSAPKGWSVQTGAWSIFGGRLVTDEDSKWAYLTVDGLKPTNYVIDFEAFYQRTGLQFAGATVRFSSKTANVTCKVQETDVKKPNFELAYVYENPNARGAFWTTKQLNQGVDSSCIVRVIVNGNQISMQFDLDKDGLFDQSFPHTTKVLNAGLIGACIWGKAQIDNFKFFNAILQPIPAARPKIGTTFFLDLQTTARKVTPWRVALSLGNSGFRIGKRRIPIDIDPVFDLSLTAGAALGLTGSTNVLGSARVGLRIPNITSLVDVQMYAAAITIDGSRPESIDNISNHVGFKIEK